jgi:hypothetical protein
MKTTQIEKTLWVRGEPTPVVDITRAYNKFLGSEEWVTTMNDV